MGLIGPNTFYAFQCASIGSCTVCNAKAELFRLLWEELGNVAVMMLLAVCCCMSKLPGWTSTIRLYMYWAWRGRLWTEVDFLDLYSRSQISSGRLCMELDGMSLERASGTVECLQEAPSSCISSYDHPGIILLLSRTVFMFHLCAFTVQFSLLLVRF